MELSVTSQPFESVLALLVSETLPKFTCAHDRGAGISFGFVSRGKELRAASSANIVIVDHELPGEPLTGRANLKIILTKESVHGFHFAINHHTTAGDQALASLGILPKISPSACELAFQMACSLADYADAHNGMAPPALCGIDNEPHFEIRVELDALDEDLAMAAFFLKHWRLMSNPKIRELAGKLANTEGTVDISKGQTFASTGSTGGLVLLDGIRKIGKPFRDSQRSGEYYKCTDQRRVEIFEKMEEEFLSVITGAQELTAVPLDTRHKRYEMGWNSCHAAAIRVVGPDARFEMSERYPDTKVFFYNQTKDRKRFTLVTNPNFFQSDPQIDLTVVARRLAKLENKVRRDKVLPPVTGRNWGGDERAIGPPDMTKVEGKKPFLTALHIEQVYTVLSDYLAELNQIERNPLPGAVSSSRGIFIRTQPDSPYEYGSARRIAPQTIKAA